jgi:hypothetical protein
MSNLRNICVFVFLGLISLFNLKAGSDSLTFRGQLSGVTHYNRGNKLPWLTGARYIPQFNYSHLLKNYNKLDFEASLNLYGNAGLDPFDSVVFSGALKPYRLWARYSTNQLEIRAGLQKINFGSASLLRPLMWFDKIDPRDPLKLTDGVWGVLGRYYFMNNANIWLWGLAGNKNPKGWEIFSTSKNIPEFGGRLQLPVPHGETGFSYHHRVADISVLPGTDLVGVSPENRFGIDAKFDMVVGWWIEASWSSYNKMSGDFSNQEILNIGLDYTIGIGNGLTVIYEQLLAAYDSNAFEFTNPTTFSLLSFNYPVGLFDSASAIIYYDWKNKKAFNFLTWQRQFNKLSLYFIGYVNPQEYDIPAQITGNIIYAGSGVQIMLVFNH